MKPLLLFATGSNWCGDLGVLKYKKYDMDDVDTTRDRAAPTPDVRRIAILMSPRADAISPRILYRAGIASGLGCAPSALPSQSPTGAMLPAWRTPATSGRPFHIFRTLCKKRCLLYIFLVLCMINCGYQPARDCWLDLLTPQLFHIFFVPLGLHVNTLRSTKYFQEKLFLLLAKVFLSVTEITLFILYVKKYKYYKMIKNLEMNFHNDKRFWDWDLFTILLTYYTLVPSETQECIALIHIFMIGVVNLNCVAYNMDWYLNLL